VREVLKTIVVADQLMVELYCFINTMTPLPAVLAYSGLDAELTFDQVLPRVSLLIHLVVDEQAAIDGFESAAIEDLAVIGDDLIPTALLREREVIKAKDHAQVLPARQRAGEDRAREAFQEQC
jgi:hypothetical protein